MKLNLLIPACCALLFASAISDAQTKHKTHTASKMVKGSSMAASMAGGKAVYTKICLPCHQADGGGVQRMNPPLINTIYVKGDKTKLVDILLKGFSEDVEINGNYYSNTMPAVDFLKDQEIADVLTYVRNSFGNKNGAITVAEVKKARAALK
jgi:mono/diheme cytochrome c family protein